jgi:hypothetical protein
MGKLCGGVREYEGEIGVDYRRPTVSITPINLPPTGGALRDDALRRFAVRRVRRLAARRWRPAMLVLAVVLLLLAPLGAIEALGQEAEAPFRDNPAMVQAVFLYSIGRYVEWPASAFSNPSSPFVIGVLGDETFGGALDAIAAKKTVQGRKIVVRRFGSLEKLDPNCAILFVSNSVPAAEQAAVIEKTKDKPIFVIGAMSGLAEHGATANFATDGDRIFMEINANAARKSQLRMDAKLLSLAKLVGATPVSSDN